MSGRSLLVDSQTRRSMERVSRKLAQGANTGIIDMTDLERVLTAAESAYGIPARRQAPLVSDRAGGTVAKVSHRDAEWLAWWDAYSQEWVSATEGRLDRDVPWVVEVVWLPEVGVR